MACAECGRDLGSGAGTGRPRRYCSRSCQSRAYRRRRDGGRLTDLARRDDAIPDAAAAPGQADDHDLVQAAIALADVGGVGAVTLRSVAHRVGIPLAETRRRFGSRDRLVAAMVQRILTSGRPAAARVRAQPQSQPQSRPPTQPQPQPRPPTQPQPQVPTPPQPDTPARRLTRLAEAEWAAYQAHPWLVVVLASSRPPLVPAVLDAARACTEAFMALGADPPSALGRYLALSGYVQGMALLLLAEHDESTRSGTDYRTWWTAEARRLDRAGLRRRHPWLPGSDPSPDRGPDPGPVGKGFPQTFDADADTWFRDGLARVITGLTTD
ncbi:hypothetical protein [Promicromonospora sukumoe]|uniref:hypothetical protein n=1 Tax=Promicromonospora sukumoe TaxID=88382 RepID=UPI000369055B|nr:hypothetical protein [Promicromonospora sukumoe]